jgi:hypothetical protein
LASFGKIRSSHRRPQWLCFRDWTSDLAMLAVGFFSHFR